MIVDPFLRGEPAQALQASTRPDLATLWRTLEGVPDPEVPVLSVVDLGIVRALDWEGADGQTLVVRVTPTYSGCPATEMIIGGIREALAALGVADVRVAIELSPPWTTDWMTPAAKDKLRAYGIAPPTGERAPATARIDVTGISPLRRAGTVVRCPRCASAATELLSQFGSTACKALYRCTACREPFDYFKPH